MREAEEGSPETTLNTVTYRVKLASKQPQYLTIEAIGPWKPTVHYWNLDRMKELIDLVTEYCQTLRYDRVLLDVTTVPGEPEAFDRFHIGLYIAHVMPGCPRVAVLARPASITKFGENTAVNRGASLLVTGDSDEAITWLLR